MKTLWAPQADRGQLRMSTSMSVSVSTSALRDAATPQQWDGAKHSPAPSCFLCPIHLDIMVDPVTLHTGMTYDRRSIETWLGGGHGTCPVTNQRLLHRDLIPNHALRRAILTWFDANDAEAAPSPSPPPQRMLPGLGCNAETKLSAALTRSRTTGDGANAGDLHRLCRGDPRRAHPEAIEALLARSFSWGPSCAPSATDHLVEEYEAVNALMDLSSRSSHRQSVEYCCGILALLATRAQGRDAIRSHPVGVARLVEWLLGVSAEATEHAVGALWGVLALADRGTAVDAAMRASAFPRLLLLLSSDCSQRAKGMARDMLKMLNHEAWSAAARNPVPGCHRSPALGDGASTRKHKHKPSRRPSHAPPGGCMRSFPNCLLLGRLLWRRPAKSTTTHRRPVLH